MKLQHSTHIDAARDHVWDIQQDVERWPDWTPTVTSIERLDEGLFGVGSSALVKQPGLPKVEWKVTDVEAGERFTWRARVWGLRMAATHELAECGSGTESTLRIELAGVLVLLLWPLVYFSAKRALQRENAGLKSHCETHEVP